MVSQSMPGTFHGNTSFYQVHHDLDSHLDTTMASYEHVSVETLTVRQLGQSYFLCISSRSCYPFLSTFALDSLTDLIRGVIQLPAGAVSGA